MGRIWAKEQKLIPEVTGHPGQVKLVLSCTDPGWGTRYLEGQGNLVNGLIMGIIKVTIWVIWVTNLLTKSP